MSLPFYLQDPGPHWYSQRPRVAIDLETTNKDRGDPRNPANRVVLACVNGKVHEDLPEQPAGEIILVAHNAKFELGWMHRYGWDLSKILPWDTMIAEYVLAGNRQVDLSLDATCRRYGLPTKDPVVDSMMKAGVCPSEMPRRWLVDRVIRDTDMAYNLAIRQEELLRAYGLMPVFFTRCILTPVLAVIEATGMRLDRERVESEYKRQQFVRNTSRILLDAMTGGINMRSRPQLAEFLYDKLGFEELKDRSGEPLRTKTGLRATDAGSLSKLKAKTKEQREFLSLQADLSGAEARLSKALDVFMGACMKQDGLLYGNFNQCVTGTHRLSSTAKRIMGDDGKERGAQFQNMPREYKRLFKAHNPDHVVTEFDYSQLEFRVAVELAHDEQGLKDIRSGHDVHRFTASVLKSKDPSEVTDEERQAAKPDTFKPLYYGQSGTARQQAYYKAFRERYPQIAKMQETWIAEAVRYKQQKTASGLIYYWPEAHPGPTGYVNGSPSICNYPIQAFATADIVPIGLVHTFWRLQDMDALVLNTIHDSIVIEHHPAITGAVVEAARRGMIEDVLHYVEVVYGRVLWVPLACEYLTAPHWADKIEYLVKGSFEGESE